MENKEKNIKDILNSIVTDPNPEWVVTTRNNLIDKMNAEPFAQINFLTKLQMKAKLFSILLLAGIASFGGVGITLHAAQTSKPGDALFGLNKAIENLQRNGITNPEEKLKFEQSILEKRQQALAELKNGDDDFRISEAQKELAEQQVNFNRANSSRSEKSPASFPENEDEFENENEIENEVENHNNETENFEDNKSGSSEQQNRETEESQNKGYSNQEKENESESNEDNNKGSNSGSSKSESEDKNEDIGKEDD